MPQYWVGKRAMNNVCFGGFVSAEQRACSVSTYVVQMRRGEGSFVYTRNYFCHVYRDQTRNLAYHNTHFLRGRQAANPVRTRLKETEKQNLDSEFSKWVFFFKLIKLLYWEGYTCSLGIQSNVYTCYFDELIPFRFSVLTESVVMAICRAVLVISFCCFRRRWLRPDLVHLFPMSTSTEVEEEDDLPDSRTKFMQATAPTSSHFTSTKYSTQRFFTHI